MPSNSIHQNSRIPHLAVKLRSTNKVHDEEAFGDGITIFLRASSSDNFPCAIRHSSPLPKSRHGPVLDEGYVGGQSRGTAELTQVGQFFLGTPRSTRGVQHRLLVLTMRTMRRSIRTHSQRREQAISDTLLQSVSQDSCRSIRPQLHQEI